MSCRKNHSHLFALKLEKEHLVSLINLIKDHMQYLEKTFGYQICISKRS